MKRSLRKMLRPGEKKEPQSVVYQGVEDDMDESKESIKVVFEGSKCHLPNIIKKHKKLNKYDDTNASPLHHAAAEGDVELMKMIINESSCEVLNEMDDYGNTPLHWAAEKNQVESVKFLLSRGANPNLRNNNMMAPLHIAVQATHNEVMKFNKGAKPCKSNKWGAFPIHQTAFSGAKKCMEIVLKFGEERGYSRQSHINFVNNRKASPLHMAVQGGDLEMIKMCLDNGAHIDLMEGADINSTDAEGRSPLILATTSASWNIVNLLLSKGARVDIKDHFGRNFLHLTVQQPYGLRNLQPEFLQMKHIKELVMDEDNDGCTPLHYACRQGVPVSVNNLLGFNVSINSKSKDKKSPLHFAASYGRINTCQRLLKDISDTRLLNEGDLHGMTPLHLAAKNGHDKVVQLLLKKGALFLSDHNGWTALHHASMGGYTQTMKVILDTNMKCTDRLDEEGNTALHFAAREGHAKAVALLLSYDAEIVLNKQQASFLHVALHNKRKEVVLTAIRNKRWDDCLKVFSHYSSSNKCPIMEMVEYLPECMKVLLDFCMLHSTEDKSCEDYHIEYNFRYLQCPLEFTKKIATPQDVVYEPLSTLNVMVQHNRIELLNHPVCKEYLLMKWMAYGFRAHMMNLGSYCLGLIPMTLLVVSITPGMAFNSTGIINETRGHTEILDTTDAFSSPVLSIIQTFSMMLGDVNYRDSFLEPFLRDELAYPFLSFSQLTVFTIFVPIALMNLLIGLAVGDIAEVQKHASLKRIAMQVELHTSLEKKLPLWFLRKVDQKSIVVYPNRPRHGGRLLGTLSLLCLGKEIVVFWKSTHNKLPVMDSGEGDLCFFQERHIHGICMNKFLSPVKADGLKDVTSLLEKQHELIKLIIQKMEIISETEDEDNHCSFQDRFKKEQLEQRNSKWNSVLKAVKAKTHCS
ncbi:Transient receptor potential cation channel subfamily A member 1 [Tupaia chinensis]|uniref:Transient receptor potential cation channel subfamily A member 1 n=1 Tax=Tupaia chinensis TaxID=246437 RepID=L9LD18_TUPCH|nr:Transient receptor potential cation channel subfamily A member 1 [Tupaia chinensis]